MLPSRDEDRGGASLEKGRSCTRDGIVAVHGHGSCAEDSYLVFDWKISQDRKPELAFAPDALRQRKPSHPAAAMGGWI